MTQPIHPMLTTMVRRMGDQMDFDGEPFGATLSTSELITLARAAIQALLEPTQDMVEIGMDYDERHLCNRLGRAPTPDECMTDQFQAILKPLLGDDG